MKSKSKLPASLRVIGRSFTDWWDGWLDLLVVVLVWIVAQVTIVFGPPATFGLYHVAYHLVNGESLGVRGLIEGARQYFWKAWLWMLLFVIVLLTMVANYTFYGQIGAEWGIFAQTFVVFVTFLWFGVQFYALPYMMEQIDKKLLVALRNGLFTLLAAPFFTLILAIVAVLVVGFSFLLVVPIFFGLPAFLPILGIRALYDRLEAFGIRKRELSPKELEQVESSRIRIQGMDEEQERPE